MIAVQEPGKEITDLVYGLLVEVLVVDASDNV
jgi:hypothetical protein